VNQYVDIEGFINLKDMAATEPPEYIPDNVEKLVLHALDDYGTWSSFDDRDCFLLNLWWF